MSKTNCKECLQTSYTSDDDCAKCVEPSPVQDDMDTFICPFHNCWTDHGWCWECAVETYGDEKAREIYNDSRK